MKKDKIKLDKIRKEYYFILKVIKTCETYPQYLKADNWAELWFERTLNQYSKLHKEIYDYYHLYVSVSLDTGNQLSTLVNKK